MKRILFVLLSLAYTLPSHATCIYAKALKIQEVKIGNLISWATSQEINNKQFTIQKSLDGIHFEDIGYVEAYGNSEVLQEYRFLDLELSTEKAFYRLAQIDFTSEVNYTHTIVFDRDQKNDYMISSMSSMITDGLFSFSVNSNLSGKMQFQLSTLSDVTRMQGLFNVIEGENTFTVNISELRNGDYKLLLNLNEEREELTIVKVNSNKLPQINYAIKN